MDEFRRSTVMFEPLKNLDFIKSETEINSAKTDSGEDGLKNVREILSSLSI